MSEERFIQYETEGRVAVVSLDRPEARNAQHPPLLRQLDEAYERAVRDDEIRVIVLRANGPHFSAGHDISPKSLPLFRAEYTPAPGVAAHYGLEQEMYFGRSRRWRDIPKPTIAAVQGKCIGGGLMLCWPCDLMVAAEDAQFSDPVLRMGVGGVEYHGHTWELGARKAKEMLFTGEFIDAQEAWRLGMVNHVVPNEKLDEFTLDLAARISQMDPFALKMAKQAVNRTLDTMGQWTAMQAVFEMHHLCHAHSKLTHQGDSIAGQNLGTMKASLDTDEKA
ncbi:MAG: enoyl-CoA hydratase [Candidatus Binatia bacterium]|nr:enoyl-CoA hydratase [Candidatus Binatia bacterium]